MRKLILAICLLACSAGSAQYVPNGTRFIRGDIDNDTQVCLGDSIRLLYSFFYPGRVEIECADAADVNDDGRIDLSDVLAGLQFLFNSHPIPAPSEICGVDPTDDSLGCDVSIFGGFGY